MNLGGVQEPSDEERHTPDRGHLHRGIRARGTNVPHAQEPGGAAQQMLLPFRLVL